MTRMRVFVVLVLALTAGGALAYGTYSYIQNVPVTTVSVPTRPVVVAAADLQLGAELRADDLQTVEWPANLVPDGTFSQPSELVGRGLIAPVVRHEPVLAAKVASKEAGTGLPPAIPPGMRAMSVRVNEVIGVAGYVLPGNHVDVLVTVTPSDQRADITSKVVLTNVPVLTAGTKLEQTGDQAKPVAVSVVTLLVTPEQSERLTLASTEGKIQLALRNPLDQGAPQTPGIKPAVLLASAAVPAPPARRTGAARPKPAPAVVEVQPPAPTIEVIRGDKRAFEVVK